MDAAADTTTKTDSSTDTTRGEHADATADVAIVGGGPAGCSAAVFTARAGLETLCFEHERSSLSKSAHLENYLGFPFGIQPTQFLELAREHVREAGCTYRREEVLEVRLEEGEPASRGNENAGRTFLLETDSGRYRAARVIVASWAHTDFLAAVPVTREPEEPGPVMVVPTDEDGRTNCDGLYAAGRITSQHHQAIVNAGHGARVALTVIRDEIPAYYNDWVVPEGYYESYDCEIPLGVEEISIDERRRRNERALERMAAFFEEHSGDCC